jgi:hypothetical protein
MRSIESRGVQRKQNRAAIYLAFLKVRFIATYFSDYISSEINILLHLQQSIFKIIATDVIITCYMRHIM